jgi:DNA-binding HxlR family transcriptional regulator
VSTEREPTPRSCSVTDALALLGDRYTLPLVREIAFGNVRFNDLVALTGAPRSLLAGRLRKLEAEGVVERRPYSDHPPRHEYRLTDAGRELLPIVLALKEWGDRHCNAGVQKAVFRHSCGAELHPAVVCAACGEPALEDGLDVVGGTAPPTIRV